MIKLKLKNALSYSGIVTSDEKRPFVTVESQKVADQAVRTGYFDIVESEESKVPENTQKQSDPDHESYTKTSLKKLNKEQQEELIVQLGGDPEGLKNEEERVALILELQEEQQQEDQGE